MTTIVDTLQILVTAQDQASDVLQNIGGAISGLSDGAEKVAAPLAGLANSILAVDTAAAGAAVAMAGMSIEAAGNFNDAFAEITTLIDAPAEGLEAFRQSILTYAADSSQSLDQVTGAIYTAISAGVKYSDSIDVVTQAEKLSVAGRADLDDTTKALAGTMNAYGASMGEAEKYSDIFFQTVKLGQTTLPELSSSLSGVTSTATLGGVQFDVLSAAIATVTAAGAPTSEAVTRINAALSAIINPSQQASELAAQLGISFDAQALKSEGLQGVLQEVAKATGGNAEQMSVLFGSTEALNAVNVLAITNAEKFDANLKAMASSAGATDTAFEKMKGSIDTWQNALQVALVALGTPLLDAFDEATGSVGTLSKAFTEAANQDAFAPLQQVVNDALGAIAEAFNETAENLPEAMELIDWSGFENSVDALAEAFGDLFGDVDLSTPEGLAEAIQMVVNTGTALINTTAGIIRGLTPMIDAVVKATQNFTSLDQESQIDFGVMLGSMKTLVDMGLEVGGALLALGQTATGISTAMNVAFGGVEVVVNALQVSFDGAVLALGEILLATEKTQLAYYTFREAIALTSDSQTYYAGKITETKGSIAELELQQDAVAANLTKNLNEMNAGWDRATQSTEGNASSIGQSIDGVGKHLDEVAQKPSKITITSDTSGLDALTGKLEAFAPKLDYQMFINDEQAIRSVDNFEQVVGALSPVLNYQMALDAEDATQKASAFGIQINSLDDLLKDPLALQLDSSSALTGVGETSKAMQDLNVQVGAWSDIAKGMETVYTGTGDSLNKLSGDVMSHSETLDKSRIKTTEAIDANGKLIVSYEQIGGQTVKASGGISIMGDSMSESAKKAKEATEKSNEYQIKMEEIASNERIKMIESYVSLNTAQLETDAKRVEATFDSINNTVSSTGDVISSLFGDLTDATSFSDKWDIQSQIDLENKRRQDVLDLQKQMTEAEIARVEAQTAALARGDALIQIDGSGLAPQLEAFMWEILKAIRVRANADFQDFLLGMGASS